MSTPEKKSVFTKTKEFMSKPITAKDIGITYILITLIAIGGMVAFLVIRVNAGGEGLSMGNLPLLVVAGLVVLYMGVKFYGSSVKDLKRQEAAEKLSTTSTTGQ